MLIDQLREVLSAAGVLTGDEVEARYHADWSRENPCRPEVVLRPADTQGLSRALALCNTAGQALVTQGGMTGLSGGATPQPGEWALSLERMRGITELDPDSMTITARAGTPLETIQQAAEAAGFILPLDLGARGSCSIGGNVSTNAGGNSVIQYGMTRALVLGLEAVLADGTVISSRNKLLKNNAGYDLKHLFIGTEGTLGIVTEVTLRLFPRTLSRQSAMCGLSSFADVVAFFKSMKRQFGIITAFEVMWENYYRHAMENVKHLRDVFGEKHPFYILLETEGNHPQLDQERFQEVLSGEMESGRVQDVVLAGNLEDRNSFWAIRDAVGEFLTSLLRPANFDIGIPLGVMEACLQEIMTELNTRFADLKCVTFGHLGDGNVHFIATTGDHDDNQAIYDIVYAIIGRYQGTITAEHGIGVMKREWLHLSRTAAEIALMKTLKQALDPRNILNPGRVIG
ncbi:MAG TPA: FAD-binding oxidoreductase [Gammaproteobacteria bacterium]|nr:FAD-binding oxidoreductase [Gammaproteobacteria bacterium]